jgi:Carboxypeptidase regulatory-like domain
MGCTECRILARRFTYLVATVLLLSSICLAQVGGRITGVVKDPSDAAIPGANVTVTNTATGGKQTATTDGQGVYSFPALPVGQYDLDVSAPGFLAQRRTGLVMDVNSALQVDVKLQLAGQSESVTVEAEAEQARVETADTQLGQTINSQQITEVPLNGRSFTDLLAVQTGVAR